MAESDELGGCAAWYSTPGGLVPERGTKLIVKASAISTTRKIARLRASLEEKGVSTDLGVVITSTVAQRRNVADRASQFFDASSLYFRIRHTFAYGALL